MYMCVCVYNKNKNIAFDTYLRIISSKYYKYGYMRVKL